MKLARHEGRTSCRCVREQSQDHASGRRRIREILPTRSCVVQAAQLVLCTPPNAPRRPLLHPPPGQILPQEYHKIVQKDDSRPRIPSKREEKNAVIRGEMGLMGLGLPCVNIPLPIALGMTLFTFCEL